MSTGSNAEKRAWIVKVTALKKHDDFSIECLVLLSGTNLLRHSPAAQHRSSVSFVSSHAT